MPNSFCINKLFNKLIFIGEICQIRNNPWNKERVEQWLADSGGALSVIEQSSVEKIVGILSEVNINFIEAYFLTKENERLWSILEQEIGTAHTEVIKGTLENFSQRFDIFWQKEETRLTRISKFLNSQSEKIETALVQVESLTGLESKIKLTNIPIQLAMSSAEKDDIVGWYSTLEEKTDLVLECSGVIENNFPFLEAVLLHELFHFALRSRSVVMSLITNIADKNQDNLSPLSQDMSPLQVLEELLVSSFTPEGYLATKYFNTTIDTAEKTDESVPHNFTLIRRRSAHAMKNLAKEYIDEKKCIDTRYLDSLIETIKNG